MIKATIEYRDGTTQTVKKKSFTELTSYYEAEREKGAVGFRAKGESGSVIESREYGGRTILKEVHGC